MRRINTLKTLAIVVLAIICAAFTSVSVSMLNVAKAETTSSQAANAVLDMNGSDSWIEVGGEKVVNLNSDNAISGLFVGATGATKMMWTGGGASEYVVRFANSYKASSYACVTVRFAVGAAGTITGYSLSDSNNADPAGSITSAGGNENKILVLSAATLADGNGMISGIKITSSGAGNDFVDYVSLSNGYVVDANCTDAWLEVDGAKLTSHTHDNNPALNIFKGDGSTEFMWTEDSHADKEISVKLATPVKAEDYDAVEVKIAGGKNKIITAYALSDTDCSYPAGVTHIFGETVIKYFTLNAKILANTDGYIEGFKFKRTDLDSGSGMYFIDYIKFVRYGADDYIKMTYPVSDNANASKADSYGAWFEVDGTAITKLAATSVLGVLDKDDVMATWTEGNMVAKPVTVRLATPVKAKKGMEVAIRLAVGKACTLDGYALSDTSFSTSAGSVVCGGGLDFG